MLVPLPSPKSHAQLVIAADPGVEVSVKTTVWLTHAEPPLLSVKLAVGLALTVMALVAVKISVQPLASVTVKITV